MCFSAMSSCCWNVIVAESVEAGWGRMLCMSQMGMRAFCGLN